MVRVEGLIAHYQPDLLVLQDVLKNVRRSSRINKLSEQIARLAETRKIKVALFSNEQVRRRFFGDGQGTKRAIAEILAERFQA